jgi:nucleotide-binding universal stress UspA family protein
MVEKAPHRIGEGGAATVALDRIVCGIDGSPEALEAARQAALLVPADGRVLLVEAAASQAARDGAEADLAAARTAVGDGGALGVAARVGSAAEVLEREALHVHADAIAVGSHGGGRTEGVLLGSVATRVIHEAPCSVLVARAGMSDAPGRIVVGADGSAAARQALAVARLLAGRTGARLLVLHVLDGTLPRGAAAEILGVDVVEVPASWSAADGLASATAPGDMLVVGSRELRGIRSLGSVSESVAHRSPASVLIVRGR